MFTMLSAFSSRLARQLSGRLRRRGLALALAAALAVQLLAAPLAWAQALQLRNFVLDNQQGDMAMRFSIGLSSLEDIRARLREGEILALVCRAELHRRRDYWLDDPLAEGTLQNILRANIPKEQFILEQPGDRIVRAHSLQQLLAEAWRSLSIDLGPFSQLERGEDYSVSLHVQLVLRDVPAWKRWTLFYSDFEVADGAHYKMNFEY